MVVKLNPVIMIQNLMIFKEFNEEKNQMYLTENKDR